MKKNFETLEVGAFYLDGYGFIQGPLGFNEGNEHGYRFYTMDRDWHDCGKFSIEETSGYDLIQKVEVSIKPLEYPPIVECSSCRMNFELKSLSQNMCSDCHEDCNNQRIPTPLVRTVNKSKDIKLFVGAVCKMNNGEICICTNKVGEYGYKICTNNAQDYFNISGIRLDAYERQYVAEILNPEANYEDKK